MKKLKINSVRKLPPKYKGTPRPAIAVAGRSNVGKSTLINTILGKKVAPTSKSPGRTRAVFRYLVNERYDLVDLPGYGYAKVGEKLRQSWRESVSNFLVGHGNLRCLFVLVDIRRGLAELDNEMIRWADEEGVIAAIILTKSDKLSNQQGLKVVREIESKLGNDYPLFRVSAMKKTGIHELVDYMLQCWSEDAFSQ